MGLSHSGRTHKQQATLDRWVFTYQTLRKKQCVILCSAGLAFETFEGTTRVAARNTRGSQQLFEAVRSSAGTKNRSFHRIHFCSSSEAFLADLCILRLVEFVLVDHKRYTFAVKGIHNTL